MRRITILGSTGSIGQQTLQVLQHWRQRVSIRYLATNTNIELLAQQVERFQPVGVVIGDAQACQRFRQLSAFRGRILCGIEGLQEAAADPENDLVVVALVGAQGILPTLAALQAGIPIALANKEVLVSAGAIVTEAARRAGVPILPIDSEHSAVLQCLIGERRDAVERLILTASGGPFRTLPRSASPRSPSSKPCSIPTGAWEPRSRWTRQR
jgi:1-deoxy-D-xylulose-5-phosphate reductoisomerase